jgi:purine nucleosidase
LLLLLTYDHVDLLGVSITPADTLLEGAVPATRKLLDLAGRSDVTVAAGTLEGPNPFPIEWRLDCLKVNNLPLLNRETEPRAPLSDLPGQEFLARSVLDADEPVTMLVTGPLTNLAWALDHHPQVEERIDEVVWMGGALEVRGNVQVEGHDRSAEWNVFWDPPSAARVFDSDLPIRMFPLDATDRVPVTDDFRRAFGPHADRPLAAAAGTMWAMTSGWEIDTGLAYFCWDTLTTASLAAPGVTTYREVRCEVVVDGPSEGRTMITPDGRPVTAAAEPDAERFYAHCLETLTR